MPSRPRTRAVESVPMPTASPMPSGPGDPSSRARRTAGGSVVGSSLSGVTSGDGSHEDSFSPSESSTQEVRLGLVGSLGSLGSQLLSVMFRFVLFVAFTAFAVFGLLSKADAMDWGAVWLSEKYKGVERSGAVRSGPRSSSPVTGR